MLYDKKKINRKYSPGNLTPIMELSWKSHGILFFTFCGNPVKWTTFEFNISKAVLKYHAIKMLFDPVTFMMTIMQDKNKSIKNHPFCCLPHHLISKHGKPSQQLFPKQVLTPKETRSKLLSA